MTQAEHEEYLNLIHAVQAGIGAWMNVDPAETEPKHLRVGITSSLVDLGALTTLLMKKGIITEEEVSETMLEAWRQEKARHEKRLSDHYQRNIKLV